MKTFKELVTERCSVRKYDSRAIEKEKLDYILDCARLAPSAVNYQPWKIYLITPESSSEKREYVQKCYDREWFLSAPYYLICTIVHSESWHRKNDGKDHGDIDIAILTEHLCLAAVEQGVGTCWVCNFDAKLCHELFNLPENEEAAVLIPMGYPAEDFKPAEKKRKSMDEIVVKL